MPLTDQYLMLNAEMAFPSFYIIDFKIYGGGAMPPDPLGFHTCHTHLLSPLQTPTLKKHFENSCFL